METVDTILATVAAAAPEIRGGLTGRRRKADEENPSGEIQMAADVWADEHLEAELTAIEGVGEFASEEREHVVDCGEGLSVAIDPLDGSSNLKSNNSMGTIVGIYDVPLPAKGTDLVASAFVLFGPITTMMVARDGSVTEYVIEDGEQRVVTEDVTLPDDPTVYGFGGRVPDWPEAFTAYARDVEDELKLRYGGAMIGDVNQVLTYGGVFAYPGLESRPEGKLRLQFEGNPMAYIIESAGGRSSDGEQSILDVTPEELHQRVPLHIGNAELIDRLESAL
ncbi:fructose-1,6-bisphosphatase [Haladaptatus paucihalophilus DX253]|uniref:Fructose-1,6-bisphosphatase class 1 n=1 Tax=Haladaptatus paucihalophilus DX253 TaxID=797209 RepID=E7QYN0_HALPU|nr:fructose-bisphosphatase class I [Haladaptatus paucihalophilus]EFW90296.1 fructose-1,6-bisphosphatase [Haladaptatus paucihalophilus DX253]SHK00439.1 fructose-1,6-bisphosphatase I [Haladaptatus paucihalophilus DX253]